MANNVQWTPQSVSTLKFDPTLGFAAAGRAFGDIQKNIADRKQVESLAAYRDNQSRMAQEELDYKLGADARAIAEEERQLAKSVEQGLLVDQLAKEGLQGAGENAKGDALFANMTSSNDPRMLEMTGMSYGNQAGPIIPQGLQAFDKFTTDSAQAMIPAAEYKANLLSGLLESGKMKYPEAEAAAIAKTAEAYPTLSDDQIKMRLDALNNMPGIGSKSSGANSSMKDATPGRSLANSQIDDALTQISADRELQNTPDTNSWFTQAIGFGARSDVGQLDPAKSDLRNLAGRLQASGITDAGALRATIDEAFDESYGTKVKDKYDWRDPAKLKALVDYGKVQQAEQSKKINSRTGAAAANTAADAKAYGQAVDQIFSLGKTQKYSDDELFQAFLNDQGQAPAPAAAVPPPRQAVAPPAPDVQADATVDPVVMADAGGIMPAPEQSIPALLGNAAKTGLEVNAEGVAMLKWLSDQTGQGVIDLVKSFKNAPEWLAEFQKGYSN